MKAYEIYHYCHIKVNESQTIASRKIPYTDLTFVLSGKLRYTVDGDTFDLECGDAIFVRPGSVESRQGLNIPTEYVSFNFNGAPLSLPVFSKGIITPTIKALIDIYPAPHMYDTEEATAEKSSFACAFSKVSLSMMAGHCIGIHSLSSLGFLSNFFAETFLL